MYVTPRSLLNVMRKRATEMSKRKAIGEFPTLFGLNVLENSVSIGTTVPGRRRSAVLYGIKEWKDQNIHTVANELRHINFLENVVGYVIGLPGTLKIENPEGAKVKSFVDQLCNTGKLDGLKYTYLEQRFASKHMEMYSQSWPSGARQAILEINSGVSILQGYLNRYCKDEDEDEDEDVDEVEVEELYFE